MRRRRTDMRRRHCMVSAVRGLRNLDTWNVDIRRADMRRFNAWLADMRRGDVDCWGVDTDAVVHIEVHIVTAVVVGTLAGSACRTLHSRASAAAGVDVGRGHQGHKQSHKDSFLH